MSAPVLPADYQQPRRTKIVATLGPATGDESSLRDLLRAGVDVCRLNFSHGTPDEHRVRLERVRKIADELRRPIAVLGDLCGPKIRLNTVPAGVSLSVGQTVRIVRGDGPCTGSQLTVNYPRFVDETRSGDRVYIDDGLVRLLAVDREADAIICTCKVGGPISTRKGVNLPDTPLSIPALTSKDRDDLHWAIRNRLDFVALSFARRLEDLSETQAIIRAADSDIPIIVKIEKAEALQHLDEFIARAGGIMIARGDMGVELDVWQVPLIQKRISMRCRAANKPVIVATQMLQSMVSSPMPTRAEVSDVANAIFDEVDAVMLSAESASGEYPVEAVQMMDRIARTTEGYLQDLRPGYSAALSTADRTASTVALGAVRMAEHINARCVAVWSTTGTTARLVSQYRLRVPVVGLTRDEATYRRMNLLHGVIPVRVEPAAHPRQTVEYLDSLVLERGLAQTDDAIVVVTSTRPTIVGATDTTMVHRVRAPSS